MTSVTQRHATVYRFPGFEISTEDARWLEEDFTAFLDGARGETSQPALIETMGNSFPLLVPSYLHSYPLWVVRLPDELSSELVHFRKSMPSPSNLPSVDLLQNKTFLPWPGKFSHLLFEATEVDWTLCGAAQTGRLVVMFITPSRTLLTTLRIGEDFMDKLWGCGMCADGNFTPHCVFSERELSAARTLALTAKNKWIFDADEQGRWPLHLQVLRATRRRP